MYATGPLWTYNRRLNLKTGQSYFADVYQERPLKTWIAGWNHETDQMSSLSERHVLIRKYDWPVTVRWTKYACVLAEATGYFVSHRWGRDQWWITGLLSSRQTMLMAHSDRQKVTSRRRRSLSGLQPTSVYIQLTPQKAINLCLNANRPKTHRNK